MTQADEHEQPNDTDVAIVGMAGRFPGAPDVDELWRRVERGDDCLIDVRRDDALRAGVSRRSLASGDHVLRDGCIEGVADFDREFFGIGARDAAIMDPQQRQFLECAWEALESAAWTPEAFPGSIGVFGGVGMNTYLLHNLLTNPELVQQLGWFLLRHTANDKDFLTTTLSYRLGLTGPSINVQTACSTSLVAVHLAVQSLLSYECDLALAGGVTIEFPHAVGYEYREGEILSPTGRCRAFDERSDGTILTGGAAVVALRRLADAIDDGDPILAVVKGSAVNNDGNRKVGYLAPSVDGHADVVKEALGVSGVDARTIGLLEAHGTGTAVGDPIEVAALTEAFRTATTDTGFCRLGSTKPNIGHLDTAAGTASLVKVIQALRHRTLPPLANHTAPSPLLDIERTPFTLSGSAAPWIADGPRRAGISSLGVGGTNAHVIVEEAPEPEPSPAASGAQLLVLSGLTKQAVDAASERLATWLEQHPDANLADVAHTLVRGRRAMPVRRAVAVTDAGRAPQELRDGDRRRGPVAEATDPAPRIGFAFPGGGAQYVGMGAGLDERFDVFHRVRAEGADIVRRHGGVDLDALFAPDADPADLQRPTASLPAVFVTSVALARQLMAWGIEPDVMLGHSLGEYVAAHLADVLSLEDALFLVVTRAALMERASGDDAAMLVVPLAEDEIVELLAEPDTRALSLATVNADDECVVAGPTDAVAALESRLAARDVPTNRIPLAAAAHSSLLDPVLDEFGEAVRRIRPAPPTRPYVSNLTGDWITAEQATDPQYWVDHLRGTVRFADGIRTALADATTVVVEVGPGHTLSSYIRRSGLAAGAFGALRHADDDVADTNHTLAAIGRLWTHGAAVDLDRFAGEGRRRLRLPTYPFQRERYFIEPGSGSALGVSPEPDEMRRIDDLDDMIWLPRWVDAPPALAGSVATRHWRVVGVDPDDPIVHELRRRGHGVTVATGKGSDGTSASDATDEAVDAVLIARAATESPEFTWIETAPALARDLAASGRPARFVALTRGAVAIDGPADSPGDAMALGVVAVAPAEYPDLDTALVDRSATDGDVAALVDDIVAMHGVVARRAGARLVPDLSPGAIAPDTASAGFRRGGTYLVTGGLGGIGGSIARHLAVDLDAHLVIVTSNDLPAVADRASFLRTHAYDHPTCRRIRAVAELEATGRKIEVVTADMSKPDGVRHALDEAERRVGHVDGAVHAAGVLRDRLIDVATVDDLRAVVDPKARAAITLVDELRRRGADLLVLVSSTSTHLAPPGQAGYVAANAVLDALAGRHGGLRVATLGSGMWARTGMAAEAARRARLGLTDGSRVDHPVWSEATTDHRGRTVVSGRLRADHHWVVDEHRTADGVAVLPGTGHLELFLAALAAAGREPVELADVTLLEPLVVPDDATVTVRVVLEPGEDGAVDLRLESDGGAGADWTPHSEATAPAAERSDTWRLDTDALARRCTLDVDDPLATLREHLRVGPRWTGALHVALGDGESFGHIRLADDLADECEHWLAHPAIVDVATAFGILLTPNEHRGELHVPVGYERVVRHGPVPSTCTVHATLRETVGDHHDHHDHDHDVVVVDVEIADEQGDGRLRIEALQLRPLHEPTALAGGPAVGHDRPAPTELGLLGLVDEIGLRPDEGVALLDRLVEGDRDRIVVSSVDLDRLRTLAEPVDADDTEAMPEPDAGGTGASIETRLGEIWRDLLGVESVSTDDDFFELGGHSLIAIRLMTRIKRELGVRLQLVTIFEAPTLGALAAIVRAERPDLDASGAATTTTSRSSGRQLVPIGEQGEGRPLYVVHGAGGNVLFLWSLARALGGDRPVYGFQAHGVNEGELPDPSVEAMATRYVAELREHAPGPYLLAGYSGGGLVTLEMVKQLQALGEQVDHVILFDSVPSGRAWPGRSARWRNLARHVVAGRLGGIKPYVRQSVLDSIRRFVPERDSRRHEHEVQDRELGYVDVGDQGFVNLYYYFSATAEQYVTGTYDVDVTVLKADLVWPAQPDDYHWSGHITGSLAWRTVPGDHHSMFYPEHAPLLAQEVREVLAGVERSTGG